MLTPDDLNRRTDMRVSPTRGARATRLLAASALAAAAVLAAHPSAVAQRPATGASTSQRATVIKVKVDPRMFGVHDFYWNSLHRAGTGSIRLWDAGVQWRDLFPTQDAPTWTRLDQAVQKAHDNGTEVTLVLGLSPSYAASTPTSAPDPALYDDYVRAVMSRYSAANWGYRGIAAYQVWNESNIETFWTGTYDELAGLVKTVYDARNAIDPGVKVIAPAMVTRLGYQQGGIKAFYATKLNGVPVWKYVDAISLNLYPTDTVSDSHGTNRPALPEDSLALLAKVRGILVGDGVPRSLPIWNTEINYGLHTGTNAGTSAKPISNAKQVAYVMRTYLLNAAQGVKRVDWYAYDMGNLPPEKGGAPIGNTLLTDPDNRPAGTLTPAGRAFTRIQSWMKGTLVGTTTKRPCSAGSTGTYTCVIRYASGVGRVYWNPWRTVNVKLAASATKQVSAGGTSSKVRGGSTIKVGYQPVLVRSAR
jgi:polysaccharide biosynthesis protein PslG